MEIKKTRRENVFYVFSIIKYIFIFLPSDSLFNEWSFVQVRVLINFLQEEKLFFRSSYQVDTEFDRFRKSVDVRSMVARHVCAFDSYKKTEYAEDIFFKIPLNPNPTPPLPSNLMDKIMVC